MGSYLDATREQVVFFDGATGTNLQLRHLGPDDFGGVNLEGCNEILVETRPDVVADLHRSFFDVGCQVVLTDTFGTLPWVLAEYGLETRTRELATRAAHIARDVAGPLDTPGRWVAGSLGPGTKIISLGQITFASQRDGYAEAAAGLLAGGVDLLVIETVQDLLQAKAAIIGCRQAMAETGRQVPLQVQVTIETTGRMLMGTEIGAALTTLDALRPDVIGLNCATGPAEMSEHLRYLSRHSRTPISVMPNAGLPSVVEGRMHYDLTPQQLAEHHVRFIEEYGVSVVGGCCGTTPEHLRAVVEACRGLTPARREGDWEPGVASIYSHVPYDQTPSLLVVGERTNANGSKKFRDAMLADDWDTCVAMAREAVKGGSHVLDVCVDYTGEDGVADMQEVAGRFATQATLPIMLDSTEPSVIEAGLQLIAGKPILNSVNLEDGDAPGTRFDRFLSMARQYGAAVVCTCIDTEGQARTAEWKVRAARAIHDLAVDRYGLAPEDLLFDPLVLPISTGMEESRRDGIETIEGIRQIKRQLPGVGTIVGLSNVSFGLNPSARHALNSVFLHECQEAGLDAAIVHAARIMPLHKIDPRVVEVCLDLIYDRRDESRGYDPLAELLRLFDGVSASELVAEDRSDWSIERRLAQRIIDGDRDGLGSDLDGALAEGRAALEIVNGPLLGGMKVVGELFGSGQMQLPFVLQSAETMKMAVAHLEPHMEKASAGGKGRIVLATVKGDVHDIGKNLVDIIFTNNGYEVRNLGIKVPLADILEAARDMQADAIGMSGLLVKSTLIMRDNLLEMNDRGVSEMPVILGGAALTRTYVERDLRSEYQGRLFYGKDAFEGLHTMDRLMELKRPGEEDPEFGRTLAGREGARPRAARAAQTGQPAGRDGSDQAVDPARPVRAPSVAGGQPALHPAVRRIAPRTRHLPRRHRRLRQRDLPLPGPVGLSAGQDPPGERRRVQGPGPGRAARPFGRRQSGGRVAAGRRLRLFRGQLRGRRSDRVEGRGPDIGVAALHLSPSGRRPLAVDRRLLPAQLVRRSRLRRLPRGHHGGSGVGGNSSPLCRRPLPGLPPSARSRRGDGRGPGGVLAPSHPRGVGIRRKRTARPSAVCSASSTGAGATPGVTKPVPTWRTTPSAPSWWAPIESAWRSARKPRGSSIRSRPPPPSSAITRRPSTSSSGARSRTTTCLLPPSGWCAGPGAPARCAPSGRTRRNP